MLLRQDVATARWARRWVASASGATMASGASTASGAATASGPSTASGAATASGVLDHVASGTDPVRVSP